MAKIGEKIGRYELFAQLGAGGMGEVFRALDTQLNRSVALKVLLVTASQAGGEHVARMLREARAAAAFNHPNAVAIYDVGEWDGLPFLVMELVVGETLRARAHDSAVLWPRRVTWLVQVARALAAAHRAGLVHRDIKPDNVMIRTEDDAAKVLDFGIARAAPGVDVESPTASPGLGTLTGQGAVMGTPLYMAPEQVRNAPLDARTDQFAWGVMGYELFAGKTPWPSTDVFTLVGAILDREAPPLAEICPALPSELVAAVHRALEKKPDDRFASMDALADAIEPFAEMKSGRTSGPRAHPEIAASTATAPASGKTTPETAPKIAPTTALAPTTEPTSVKSLPMADATLPLRRRARVVAAIAAGLALAVGVTFLATKMRGASITYCVEMNPSRTGPRCGISLTEEEASHREDGLRVTTDHGHVVKVEIENSIGRHWSLPDRDDILEYAYDGERLTHFIARERHGRFLRRCNYSADMSRADCTEEDGITAIALAPDSRAVQIRYEYDANGFVSKERYFGRTGKPRALANEYGQLRERRADGMVTRTTSLGADGLPAAAPDGVCATANELDARGFIRRTSFFACDGSPTSRSWVHATVFDRDAFGSATMAHYFDTSNHATSNGDHGGYALRMSREEHGHESVVTSLDANGAPRAQKHDASAESAYGYDEHHFRNDVRYLDGAHNLVGGPAGAAEVKRVWDARGDLRDERNLDANGKPILNMTGFVVRKTEYDERGRRVRMSHFNAEEQLAPWIDGPAVLEFRYDDRDQLIERRTLDVALHAIGFDTGVATTRLRYDARRRKMSVAFSGVNGEPVLSEGGCAAFANTFNDDDDLVESACVDVNGGAAYENGQHAFVRRKYDDAGRIVEESYYDANKNLLLLKDRYAIVRHVLDRSGDILVSSYFGQHEEPIVRAGGYAREETKYDARRRKIATARFDAAGARVSCAEGWSIARITYDERGLVLRTAYFDRAGNPVLTNAGYAALAKTYDDRGNRLTETGEGIDGAPIVFDEHFATKKSAYNERDRVTDETRFDAAGKPVTDDEWATRHTRYDAIGNIVEQTYLDADHRPVVVRSRAYASMQSKFDARRRLIESSYFDETGAPMKGPDGIEVVRYERDAFGYATETRYFGANDVPAISKDGKQVVKATYDSAGRVTEERYFDAAGAPKIAKDGCAARRTKYDERGRKIEETCLDEKGNPGLAAESWAIRRTVHDARGNVVDASTYGPDGALRADASGVASRKSRYDERNLKLETSYLDVSGHPVRDKRGVALTKFHYDDAGALLDESNFDESGKAVTLAKPQSGIQGR